jgi:16S rRNA (uracil1498-N3)-methyltransferase
MRVSRLYTASDLTPNKTINLDDDNAHYARSVLRLKQNDLIILFNGDGCDYHGAVSEITRKNVSVSIKSREQRSVESPLTVTLGLGISRGDKMDFSVQKAVELGVNQLTPLLTERCVVQFKGETQPQRWQHWQKIIQHASEQSGRTCVPRFAPITPLADWLAGQQGLKLFLDPYAEKTLNDLPRDINHVTLMTGPEGGFSDKERELAKAAGFIPVRLGQRILRTETASLAALSAVQLLWGDFGRVD